MLDLYLNRTDVLLVIGFSFRDPVIVQAFSYAMKNNSELKIYIINPEFNPDEFPDMDRFINDNKDRVEHIEMYFGTDELLNKLKELLV